MLRNMFFAGLAVLAVAATSQAAIIVDAGVVTPGLPGFKTFTVSVESANPISAVNFVGDGSNDAGTGFGFFGAMNQRNPFGLPTIFADNNGVMIPAGFDTAQDSQFKVVSSTVVVPPGLAEEGPNVLQAAWAWSTPQNAPLSIAQIVIPDAAVGTVSYRGQITVNQGGINVDLPVEVGTIGGGAPPVPPVGVDTNLGSVANAIINHVFTTSAGDLPISWSGLMSTGGSPNVAATLDAAGNFQWHTIGSARPGAYSWKATATNAAGSDNDVTLRLDLIVPEPATLSLVGLAIVGLVGCARRRS